MKFDGNTVWAAVQNAQKLAAITDPHLRNLQSLIAYDGMIKFCSANGASALEVSTFRDLVDLVEVLSRHLPAAHAMRIAGEVMRRRPDLQSSDSPVNQGQGTPDVIRLFGLMSSRLLEAIQEKGCPNVLPMLRQVLSQHAHLMTVKEMRAFLEASPEVSTAWRFATRDFEGTDSPKCQFVEGASFDRDVNAYPNQAWYALLQNAMGGQFKGCEVAAGLTPGIHADGLDRLARLMNELGDSNIKITARRTDVLFVLQLMERMAAIANHDAHIPRGILHAKAIVALADLAIPSFPRITDKNCIYQAKGFTDGNPMADGGLYGTRTLWLLEGLKVKDVFQDAHQAIERVKVAVLLHTAHISDSLRKQNAEHDDAPQIRGLSNLCYSYLNGPKALAALNDRARFTLTSILEPSDLRRQLLLKVSPSRRGQGFVTELGV